MLPQLIGLLAILATALASLETQRAFEQKFIEQKFADRPNTTVKLVGFVRVWMPHEVREAVGDWFKNDGDWFSNDPYLWPRSSPHWWDYWDDDELKHYVYFPVRDGMLLHGRSLLHANEHGEIARSTVDGDMAVLGRRQTEDVHGVEHNVIRDGNVLLSSPRKPVRAYGNAYVYDFGTREPHEHEHEHDGEGDNRRGLEKRMASCFQNHGNKICTFLDGVGFQGRCPSPSRSQTKCVDYNGFRPKCHCISDCGWKDPDKYIGFVGSDCWKSLGMGNCWNEFMG